MRRLWLYSLMLLVLFWLTGCMVRVRPVPVIEIEPPIRIMIGH